MDDFSITRSAAHQCARQLRVVNRPWVATAAPMKILRPLLCRQQINRCGILRSRHGDRRFFLNISCVGSLRHAPGRTLAIVAVDANRSPWSTPARRSPGGCPPICSTPIRVDVAMPFERCLTRAVLRLLVDRSMFLQPLRPCQGGTGDGEMGRLARAES